MMRAHTKKRVLMLSLKWWILKKHKMRQYWVHPLNKIRRSHGEFFTVVKSLEKFPFRYFQYFRMSKEKFKAILLIIKREISPKKNNFRSDIISAKERLALTLRFLATGVSYTDLAIRFCMGISTVHKCIVQTIDAIILKMQDICMPKPTTGGWKSIAKRFLDRWNFPNCLGAVDGKHVLTFAPNNTGSLYFNYKKSFSTVLMAAVDADYKFIMVDIGAYGSNSDSAIFSHSKFGNDWLNNPSNLHIPADCPLPGTLSPPMPYVIIGDEAFALKPTLLTPYPGDKLTMERRIFNYRLSRARRIVENAFGILAHTWRILLKRIEVQSSTINKIILACCILHNYIRMNNVDTTDNEEMNLSNSNKNDKPASEAVDVRNAFSKWCIAEGDLDFQHKMI